MLSSANKYEIIQQLRKELLPLQGFHNNANQIRTGLGILEEAFPQSTFPLGTIHEFISDSPHHAAATNGFLAAIAGSLMQSSSMGLWIGSHPRVYPPALKCFGITPEKILFVNTNNPKERLWVMEEALKCEALAFVLGEIKELSFIESRRLQLAVENSHVTGFIHRHKPKQENTTACIARWKIKSIPSETNGIPGVGFTRWQVQLVKVRNGRPGSWELEWSNGAFRHVQQSIFPITSSINRKTG